MFITYLYTQPAIIYRQYRMKCCIHYYMMGILQIIKGLMSSSHSLFCAVAIASSSELYPINHVIAGDRTGDRDGDRVEGDADADL